MARKQIIFKMKILLQGSGHEAQLDDVVSVTRVVTPGPAVVVWVAGSTRSEPVGTDALDTIRIRDLRLLKSLFTISVRGHS